MARVREIKEQELIKRVIHASNTSFNKQKHLYDKLQEADDIYSCYLEPLPDPIDREKEEAEERTYGIASRIKIPFITALVQALVSYLMAIFTSKLPFIEIQGQGPEDVIPAKKQTLLIALQMQRVKGILKLHQFLFDVIKYGWGWMEIFWDRKENKRGIIYEGNNMENIYPQYILHDPRVSLLNFQDGEYVIQIGNIHRMNLYTGAKRGEYFDIVDEIPREIPPHLLVNDEAHPFLNKNTYFEELDRDMVFLERAFMKIRPRQFGLDESDDYEIWEIDVANRQRVVKAIRAETTFGGFPFIAAECYPDMYSMTNEGLPGLLKPLQQYVDFLFNSHLANVRKGVNMTLVYDPYSIEEDDLFAHKWVKMIRMKEIAAGKSPHEVIYQIPINDVTQNNIRDAEVLIQFMQRISGIADIIMGMPYIARRSATEISASQRFAANRLKTIAEVINEQALVDMVEMFVMNNIDYISGPLWLRIMQGWEKEYAPLQAKLKEETIPFVRVEGNDLVGNFDYVLTEALLPIERISRLQSLTQVMQVASQSQWLAQELNLFELFKEWARSAGITNIEAFRRVKPIVTPEPEKGGGVKIQTRLAPEEIARRSQETAEEVLT